MGVTMILISLAAAWIIIGVYLGRKLHRDLDDYAKLNYNMPLAQIMVRKFRIKKYGKSSVEALETLNTSEQNSSNVGMIITLSLVGPMVPTSKESKKRLFAVVDKDAKDANLTKLTDKEN